MLSSSLDTLLKVSKTTSPQKLFAFDCVTLYLVLDPEQASTRRFKVARQVLHGQLTQIMLGFYVKIVKDRGLINSLERK